MRGRRLTGWAIALAMLAGLAGPAGAMPTSGALYAWGEYPLGDLSRAGSARPVRVSLPAGVEATAVATGYGRTAYAIGDDGIAYAWGDNPYGQLGNGTATPSIDEPIPVGLPFPVTARAVASNGNAVYVLGSDGVVYAAGYGPALGNGSSANLRTPQPVALPPGTTIEQISAGESSGYALSTGGVLYAWGDNSHGQLGNGTTTAAPLPITVSMPAGVRAEHLSGSHAIGSDGRVYSWGVGQQGQLGDGTTGTALCGGTDCQLTPVAASLPPGVVATALAHSGYTVYAAGSDGRAYTWGRGTYGALGTGGYGASICAPYNYGCELTPKPILLPAGVSTRALAAMTLGGLALGSDDRVRAWGYGFYGALGNGATGSSASTATPVIASLLPDGIPIAIGAANDTGYAIIASRSTVSDPPAAVVATAGDRSASVSWTAPASDGGTAIDHYAVTARDLTDPGLDDVVATSAAAPATVSGLRGGHEYVFTVVAVNEVGSSEPSAPSDSITVLASPRLDDAAVPTVAMRQPFALTFTADGYPTATLTLDGVLPAGLSFSDGGDGSGLLSGAPAVGTAGDYPLTLTAVNGVGDAARLTFTLTVSNARYLPAFLGPDTATATYGQPFTMTVDTSGYPAPTLTRVGTLPSGTRLTLNGDGTATLTGTPAGAAAGPYMLGLVARNAAGVATQTFTLTVVRAPALTAIANRTVQAGSPFSLIARATGWETPALTLSGTLPEGISFRDDGDGTAAIEGVPAAGSGGVHQLAVTAANQLGSASEPFTLTVTEPPAFTSSAAVSATEGEPVSFAVTTSGYPRASLTRTGTLPRGLVFHAATGLLDGTPRAGSAGEYPLTFTARNSAGSISQSVLVTVATP